MQEYMQCTEADAEAYNTKLMMDRPAQINDSTYSEWMKAAAENTIPRREKTTKMFDLSDQSKELIDQRADAIKARDMEKKQQLTKLIKKSVRNDRRQANLAMVQNDLDPRDRWLGLQCLRKEAEPIPYALKDKNKQHVPMERKAQAAADFLATKIWGETQENSGPAGHQSASKIVQQPINMKLDAFDMTELIKAIRKLKRRKTPGPDDVPIELFKELDEPALTDVLQLINQWYEGARVPKEILQARVVLIFKKGDKTNLANYRPISLLNTIYKIYAAMIQTRLAAALEPHLQNTQYGFREKRGTADAISYIRRLIDKGEMTRTRTLLVLLDWEKAFDRILHHKLIEALQRMNVPNKICEVIQSLYTSPEFYVTLEGRKSEMMQQKTGIRQGCPLSPYLFIIVMTVMYHDVHANYTLHAERQRIVGTHNDEVLYADDTICFAQTTTVINRMLSAIEIEGKKYGMRLNKDKCEYISIGQPGGIVRFYDGTKVPVKEEVKYLGCIINAFGDPNREVSKRIATCMTILNKLHLFWRHSDCTIRLKIQAYDAIVRAKLMYGLESVVFNESHLKKLDTFQLKGLRKILKLPTTYINREMTNLFVVSEANKELAKCGGKPIQKLSEFHKQRRKILLAKLITLSQTGEDPCARATLEDNLIAPHDYGKKRVGRPRLNWVKTTISDLWEEVKQEYQEAKHYGEFDPRDPEHDKLMKRRSQDYNKKYDFIRNREPHQ